MVVSRLRLQMLQLVPLRRGYAAARGALLCHAAGAAARRCRRRRSRRRREVTPQHHPRRRRRSWSWSCGWRENENVCLETGGGMDLQDQPC